MRLGILGGAFDPIHYGHLRAAEEVHELLSLDKIIFIPTAMPPHKANRRLTAFNDRLKMAELATQGISHFAVSDIESQIPGRSYSIETLRRLRAKYERTVQFYFIVGLDAFSDLPSWKEYRIVPSHANLVVVGRPGYSENELIAVLDRHFPGYVYGERQQEYMLAGQLSVFYRQTTSFDISSTFIRRAVNEGRSIRFLLPLAVEEYIYEKRIYGKQEQQII